MHCQKKHHNSFLSEPFTGSPGNNQANAAEQMKRLRSDGTFQLCEPWNSGSPSPNLTWMEGADRLFPVLNDRKIYNMFLAPGQAYGEQTNISIALYIESMSSFKAQTMDFEVDMYFAMSWFDKRLRHNCTHPILVTSKRLTELIWHPDLYFVNSKFAYLQEVTTPNLMMLVYPDGMIFKSMRCVLPTSTRSFA